MNKTKLTIYFAVISFGLFGGVGFASAAILEVGAGRAYSTIQAAVNAAQAGDTVLVYPGTYNESVRIPDGKQGTATSPITIKALYPARKPLDGGAWADTADKRSVVNAGTGIAAIYNDDYNGVVSNIIIDGFYITGGGAPDAGVASGGIYFLNDNNIWIRNNVVLDTNPYASLISNGERTGNIHLMFTRDSLIQNNYLENTYARSYARSAFLINVNGGNGGVNNIVEYNEGYIGSGAAEGSFAYVHYGADNTRYRYNYILSENSQSVSLYARFRDSLNFTITNNYIRSTAQQGAWIIHENTESGAVEQHIINNNTLVYEQGIIANIGAFRFSNLAETEVRNNIIYSGIFDTGSCAIGRFGGSCNSPSGSPNPSLTIDNTMYYNISLFIDNNECGTGNNCSPTNTLNINPNINPTTGCAASVDNSIYGANLNVSNVPYRKCDGSFYAASGKFGINVVVSDGGTPPPDNTPPSAPTGLVVN